MERLNGLTTRELGRHFTYFESVGSTNTWLLEHAANLPHGAAVIAERQTAGKGRRGKSWQGDEPLGLALSVLVDWDVESVSLLPLLVGLSACYALERLCCAKPALKWSNDVILDEKKLAGILCESVISSDRCRAVLGIGINLAHTQARLGELGLVYATSLLIGTKTVYSPAQVGAFVLNSLEETLDRFAARGFEQLRREYINRCATIGRQVLVVSGGEERRGMALDIAPDGGLVCEIDGQIQTLYAGDVSVRGLMGYV